MFCGWGIQKDHYGVELVEMSLDLPHTLSLAMKGISAMFVPILNQPNQEVETKKILDAAKSANVKFICVSHDVRVIMHPPPSYVSILS